MPSRRISKCRWGAGGAAAAPDGGDDLAGLDLVADLDQILLVVGVNGDEAIGMLDLHEPAVRRRTSR